MLDHIKGSVTTSTDFEVAAPVLDRGGAVFNVKHPEFWDPADVTQSFEDAAGAAAAGGVVYVPQGTYQFATNAALSGNWHFAPGAVLKPASGVTVSITGAFEARPAFLFDESLGGKVAFAESTTTRELYVEWWHPSGLNHTAAFTKAMVAQAATRSIPIQLLAKSYLGSFVIPDELYLSTRGGFILRGMGPRATGLQAQNAATPAIKFEAAFPTGNDDPSHANFRRWENKLHLTVTIENLSLSGRYTGSNDVGSANVIHLRGLRGNVDIPTDGVGRRIYGRLRDLFVQGISTTSTTVAYSTENAILIRSPLAMHLENIITEASDWGLKLEGGSNTCVLNFNTLNSTFGGIFIDEGGAHVFVRPRIEDRFRNKTGVTACYYLKNTGSNTFIGWGSEGKGGIDYTAFLEGTKSSRPVSGNVFMGAGLAGPTPDYTDPRTDFVTLLIKGNCFNNHFHTNVSRPVKIDRSQSPAVLHYTFDTVRLEPVTVTEDNAQVTFHPRHNRLELATSDNADPFPKINLGTGPASDPASNIVEIIERNAGKKRVLGRDIAKSASYTLKEHESGLTFNNHTGPTIRFTLPAAKLGLEYSFISTDDAVRVAPIGTERIRGASAAGKYLEITAGGGATLRCVDDNSGFWELLSSHGTLTFEP